MVSEGRAIHCHGAIALNSGSSLLSGNCIKQSEVDLSKYPNVNITLPRQGQSSESFDVSVPASSYLLPEGDRFCMGIGSASSIGMVMGDVFMVLNHCSFPQNCMLRLTPWCAGKLLCSLRSR